MNFLKTTSTKISSVIPMVSITKLIFKPLRCLFTIICFALISVLPTVVHAATILMSNGTVVSTCSDNFYDSGGSSGSYSVSENYTITIYPSTPGAPVSVKFTTFNVESGYDFLYIYNGSSTAAPLMGTYTGTTSPGTKVSTASDGSLTFKFTSDASVVKAGWVATVTCGSLSPCGSSITAGSAVASATTLCPGSAVTLSLSGFTAASGITYQWDTSATGTGGWAAVTAATTVPFTWTPPGGRTLYYRCRTACTSSGATSTSATVAVTSTSSSLPYSETFETTSPGSFPPCTYNTFSDFYEGFYVHSSSTIPSYYPTSLGNHTSGGSTFLFAGYYLGMVSGTPDFFFTPAFSLTTGKTYQFSYWYNTDGYGPYVAGAYYGTAQTKAAMTTAIGPDIAPNNTTYKQYVASFSVTTSGSYYMGIKISQNSYEYGMAIDDIGLIELPPCTGTPAYAGKANVSPNLICTAPGSVALTISGTPPVSGLNYQWYESLPPFTTYNIIPGATTASYTRTGVATKRYFYCSVTCAAGGSAVNSDTVVVNVAPLTPPYIETFETTTPGVNVPCASYTYGWASGYEWWINSGVYAGIPSLDNHTPGGSNWLFAGYGLGTGSGTDEYWFSPGLALTAAKAYQLTYWYNTDGYTTYKFGARVGTAQTAAAMTTALGPDIYDNNTTYKQYAGGFIASTTGTYYLGIKFKSSDYWYGSAIDDIGLNQLPSCSAKPVAGTATASPNLLCSSTSTSTISLVGTSLASDLTFQWQKSTTGLPGSWSNITTAGTLPSYTTTTPAAAMYYRCYVICPLIGTPNADTSAKVYIGTTPITPPYIETFESGTAGVNMPCASYTGTWGSPGTYWYLENSGFSGLINHTVGGSYYLHAGYYIGTYGSALRYWFSPAIKFTAGATYEASYWYMGSGTSGGSTNLGLYYGTAQTAAAMTTAITPDLVGVNTTTYKQLIGRFVAPTTANYYLGIKVNSTTYSYPGVAIDDIGLTQLPPCTGAPTVGTISASPTLLCSPGTVSLNMDLAGVSKAAGLSYQWYDSSAATAGTWVALGTALTGPAYTTPSISTCTWFRCVVKCTLTGDYTTSSSISVCVGAIIPPYVETFESVAPGTNAPCASATGWSSGYLWYTMGAPYYAPSLDNHTPGGSNWLMGGYYISLGGTSDYWFTPGLKLTGGKLYQFSYWYVTDGYLSSGYPFQFGAYIGTAQTAAAMTTAIGPVITPGSPATYQRYVTKFTPTTTGTYYIGIYGKSNYDYGFGIDDIGLQEVPPCSAPVVAGTVTANPTQICSAGGTTTLDLSGSTLATGLTYTWQSRTATTGWGPAGLGVPPFTSSPVSEKTWFRCIVKCAATGITDTSAATSVGVGAFDLPYSENFESTAPGTKPICSDATVWGQDFLWNTVSGTSYFSNHTPGGKKYLIGGYYLGFYDYTYYGYTLTNDNYWFTPGLNLNSRYKYELSLWYVTNSSGNRMGVYYGTSQTPAGMSNTLRPLATINNTSYNQFDTTFKPTATGVYYIGLQKTTTSLNTYSYPGVGFDDINLNYAPCDGLPFSGNIMSSFASGTGLCAGTPVTLTDTGASIPAVPGIKYQWQYKGIGSGTPTAWTNMAGKTDTILSGTNLVGYQYRLAVVCTNTHDSAFSSAYQVPALPPHPPVYISPSSSPIDYCLGDTVKLNATSFPSGVYEWSVDSAVVFGWTFSDIGATKPGMYMVKVTSPLSPCPAYSDPVKLQVTDPGYSVSIAAPADSFVCAGNSILLNATSSKSGVTYQWRKDNVIISGATSSTFLVSSTTGTGYYSVTAFDGISICPAISRTILITIKPNPPAVITPAGGSLTACAEIGVLLNASTGGYTYEWSHSGSPIVGWNDSSELVTNSGTYTVKVRSSDGCVTISAPVTVNILPSPVPEIIKSTIGSSIILSTRIATYLSYKWIRNGGSIPDATTPTDTLIKKGTYKVIVTDANGCTGESLPMDIMDDALGIGNVVINGSDIKVYPNPTASKVFIESPVNVNLTIKDASGKTVYSQSNISEVDMSKFADGVYLFMISDKTGKQLLKEQRVNKVTSK